MAARLELALRYLHVYGPTGSGGFAKWAGIGPREARAAFDGLDKSLTAVSTPTGEAWILSSDEASFRSAPPSAAAARLLPSGDSFFLLHGADRELVVLDAKRRGELWTPRVWPGALLLDGEVVGTWRRAGSAVTIESWRRLAQSERAAVEAEAESLPLPDVRARVRWDG
jgi:hypothetical protein